MGFSSKVPEHFLVSKLLGCLEIVFQTPYYDYNAGVLFIDFYSEESMLHDFIILNCLNLFFQELHLQYKNNAFPDNIYKSKIGAQTIEI